MNGTWKGLICWLVVFVALPCAAATTVVQDTLHIVDAENTNDLQAQISNASEDLNWVFDLQLVTYSNKLETSDKVTLFRSNLEFQFASNFLLGGGVDYSYAALEKMTGVDPHLMLGFRVDRAEARALLFTNEFRQGASPDESSPGNVREGNSFLFTMSGTALDLRANFMPWLDGRFFWMQQTSNVDFSNRVTGAVGTSFSARRFGSLVSTVEQMPKQFQTFQLVFRPAENFEIDFQHNRSQEEVSREWALDSGALLKVRLQERWKVGYGLGENSYQSRSQRYALANLNFQF